MNQPQRKLVLSWIIGGVTLVFSAYLLKVTDSYAWIISMIIGMSAVKYLRSGMDMNKNNIFHYMSEKMKVFSAIYLLFLAGLVFFYVMVKPGIVGNNVGIIMMLAFAPFLIVAIKIDIKIFQALSDKNV